MRWRLRWRARSCRTRIGYGLPIGGVLATDNAAIPYAVGVDIACRMKLTVYDRKANTLGRPAKKPRLVG